MFDPLLYLYMIATMKHAGHFLVMTALLQRLKARCRAIGATVMPNWNGTAAAKSRVSRTTCRASTVCQTQEELMELLGRFEAYVTSIA
jgi:hypothetical protein